MEATECGAASLGIILGYYGRFAPLPELRQQCGVSRDGSKASNLLKAARRYGLQAKGYSKQLNQLRELKLPFIIFWQFNHFLVVEGYDHRWVYLNDPASGHRRVSWEEFGGAFTGVVLVCEPGETFERRGSPKRIWPGLWSRFQGNLAPLFVCFLAGLLLVLPGLALPTYTRIFLDAVVLDGRYGWFRPLLVAMVATMALQVLLNAVQLSFLRQLKITLSARLKSQFFWHLLRLPVEFYAQRYPGEVIDRAELNDQVVSVLTGDLVRALIALVTMLVYGVTLFFYDVTLTLIGISFAVANLAALRWVSRHRIEANMKSAQDEGNVQATAIAGIASMESLKAGGAEDGFFAKWSGYFAKASNARQAMESSSLMVNALPGLTTVLTNIVILVVGGLRVIDGAISIGMLVAIQSLLASFLEPITMLLGLGAKIQELHGNLNRLDDVLENPIAADSVPTAIPTTDPAERDAARDLETVGARLQGTVELRQVSFGYSPLEPPLIDQFDMRIEPGQRVAFVGGSGSGKSTLAKLICGFYRPWSGEIRFDGHERTSLPRELLTNSLGLVEQDIFLFEGKVRDNLTLWDQTATDDTLWQALEDAHIADVVANLPGGLDAEFLEAGSNLSGGQRQRIEIARALVNNPSILVLDEATSALDTETERIIDENIRRRGCTTIIVAHRLSTIRDCDEIIVLERGRVVERGTHDQLWNAGGLYQELLKHGDDVTEQEEATP